jgi:predicted GNAT family N-acyltransferase
MRSPTTAWARPSPPGRLLPASEGEAKVGRMAVHQVLRGCGVGEQVLRTLAEAASAAATAVLEAACPAHGADFYARLGFAPEGEPFEEAGIPHLTMTSALPLAR